MNALLLSIDLLNNIVTTVDLDLPQSLYERWKLVGNVFVLLKIGQFRQDILYLNDSPSEHELQFTIDAFTNLVGISIAVQHDTGIHYWKFQVVTEENRRYLEDENTPF